MATADAVAIPTALWAALALKFDRLDPALERTLAYFLVAVASALLFFSMFGLYRAVIRFVGPKAMVTVVAGVSLSVLVLAVFDRFAASHQIPLSAFGFTGRWHCCMWGAAALWRAICSFTLERTANRSHAWRSTVPAMPGRACAQRCSAGRILSQWRS